MLMKARYVTSLPNWTYKIFVRDASGKLNHAVLTGEDTKEVHINVAAYIRDNIGWEMINHVTKKPLSDEYGNPNGVEVSTNYLMGLLY